MRLDAIAAEPCFFGDQSSGYEDCCAPCLARAILPRLRKLEAVAKAAREEHDKADYEDECPLCVAVRSLEPSP